MSSSSYQGLPC